MRHRNEFQPDWVSAPGETISDILEERDISQIQFAQETGLTLEQAGQLLKGHARITSEIAQQLVVVLGGTAAFWLNRESQFRHDLARLHREVREAASGEWLSELPLVEMLKFGWLSRFMSRTGSKEAACLQFFGVADATAWRETCNSMLQNAAFRTSPSFASRPGAVAAWLRQGEIEAESISCEPWDGPHFQAALSRIRRLTWKKQPKAFVPLLQKQCAECGVAVVVVRAPSGCRASGATRFLSPNKALLLLSFRYLSDDHFWFTFFHEAGHLLLHSKRTLFLEGRDIVPTKEEGEANEFAASVLIPDESRRAFLDLPVDGRQVLRFAKAVGVSPGIVVGQLQHLGRFRRNQLNNLKRRFTWGGD
jgi:HTH-type transcriptional regulator/antitoxin HigA